jgi:hypothetical protein
MNRKSPAKVTVKVEVRPICEFRGHSEEVSVKGSIVRDETSGWYLVRPVEGKAPDLVPVADVRKERDNRRPSPLNELKKEFAFCHESKRQAAAWFVIQPDCSAHPSRVVYNTVKGTFHALTTKTQRREALKNASS